MAKVRNLPPGKADGIWTSPIWSSAKWSRETVKNRAEDYYSRADHNRFHESCSEMRAVMDSVHCELMNEAGDMLLAAPSLYRERNEVRRIVAAGLRRCLAALRKDGE